MRTIKNDGVIFLSNHAPDCNKITRRGAFFSAVSGAVNSLCLAELLAVALLLIEGR